MKKIFRLNGLECANCASKIQDRVNKLDGVISATVNFMTAKLIIEGDESKMDSILESTKAIIKKLEPHVEMAKA